MPVLTSHSRPSKPNQTEAIRPLGMLHDPSCQAQNLASMGGCVYSMTGSGVGVAVEGRGVVGGGVERRVTQRFWVLLQRWLASHTLMQRFWALFQSCPAGHVGVGLHAHGRDSDNLGHALAPWRG